MTDSWWVSAAAAQLRAQVDKRWPHRDHGADGTIGDAAHSSRESDHNPCWDCTGAHHGVVRALDIDADLGGKHAAQRLANQLVGCAHDGKDRGRLSYVICNGRIASGTYPADLWEWRPYDGTDPHTSHIHVSFTEAGDLDDHPFPLAIFDEPERRRLTRLWHRLTRRIRALIRRRRKVRHRLDDLVN